MLDTLKLGLDVLLRNLKKAKDTVVCLLCNHVKNVAEALRASLAPSLVNPEGHVLCTLLPTKKLNIGFALIETLCVIEAWPREDPNHLGKLHCAFRQRCHAMLQVLKWLLVDFGVQNIVHCIHLCLPVLLVHVALLLHLPHCIAVLLDIHFPM